MNSFRQSWIAAVDKNRSLGAPYWPEAFWASAKTDMQKADLMPMFVTFYQHGVSRQVMGEVLDAYRTLGIEHFQGSPACFRLGDVVIPMMPVMERLKLAETQDVLMATYDGYKPQIKAARERYLQQHPDWVHKPAGPAK